MAFRRSLFTREVVTQRRTLIPDFKRMQKIRPMNTPGINRLIKTEIKESTSLSDPAWDDFLRQVPCGQYQQSSLWAEFKAGDGWQPHRVQLFQASRIIGGFQILWKKKLGIRIGYISKGPVLHPESASAARELAGLLSETSRRLGLVALIMQAPDETTLSTDLFHEQGFLRSNPQQIVEATYVVDLSPDVDEMRNKFRPTLRRNFRKAQKNPPQIRVGTEKDLDDFFRLMASSCQRQGTTPNPPLAADLYRLWQIFSRRNEIRLTLAEIDGQATAAILDLAFGNRLTAWKKGWDGNHGSRHPNEYLEIIALEWGSQQGFRLQDFCSFSRTGAEKNSNGVPVAELLLSSRDMFHTRFGGRPMLLPPAMILVPNPLLRWVYRQSFIRWEQHRLQASRPTAGETSNLSRQENLLTPDRHDI